MAMDLLYLIIFQSGYSVGRQVEEVMIMKGEGLHGTAFSQVVAVFYGTKANLSVTVVSSASLQKCVNGCERT